MFGIAIGGAAILNLLLPYAFKSRNDVLVAIIQIMQGLVQGLGYPSMHVSFCNTSKYLEDVTI